MSAASADPRCRAARSWLSAAIDGEATPSEQAALRAHLAECQECRNFAALTESLALRVRTAEPEPFELAWPPSRPGQVAQPAAPARRRRRARDRTRATFAVLAVAAAAGGVFVSGALERSPQTTQVAGPTLTVADASADFVDGRPVGPELSQRDAPMLVQGLPVNRDRMVPDDPAPPVTTTP